MLFKKIWKEQLVIIVSILTDSRLHISSTLLFLPFSDPSDVISFQELPLLKMCFHTSTSHLSLGLHLGILPSVYILNILSSYAFFPWIQATLAFNLGIPFHNLTSRHLHSFSTSRNSPKKLISAVCNHQNPYFWSTWWNSHTINSVNW